MKVSIFTIEMVKIIDSEVLENGNGYRLERLDDGFILEPLGMIQNLLTFLMIVIN